MAVSIKYWICGSAGYMITPPLICVSKHQFIVLKHIQLSFFICAKIKIKKQNIECCTSKASLQYVDISGAAWDYLAVPTIYLAVTITLYFVLLAITKTLLHLLAILYWSFSLFDAVGLSLGTFWMASSPIMTRRLLLIMKAWHFIT